MKKRVIILTLVLLYGFTASVYAETNNLSLYGEPDKLKEKSFNAVPDERYNMIQPYSVAQPSVSATRLNSSVLTYKVTSRASGAPNLIKITSTLYIKSGKNYVSTGKCKSETRVKPSGLMTQSGWFSISRGKSYKVKVVFTEKKGNNETKVTRWSNVI